MSKKDSLVYEDDDHLLFRDIDSDGDVVITFVILARSMSLLFSEEEWKEFATAVMEGTNAQIEV